MQPPSWQLPPGVDRNLWDYFHNRSHAQSYDNELADSQLLQIDQRFAERHFHRPGRLLDLGCGTGRLLVPFARRGFQVVGVDLSKEMLEVAAAKAREANINAQLVKANIVELDCFDDGSFDYIACLFSTLGMVLGHENRRQVLGHVHRLLKPGGKFVVHVHNLWHNLWLKQTRWWLVRDVAASTFLRRPGGDHVMPAHLGLGTLTLHLFTRREISRLLRSIGLRVVECMPLSPSMTGHLRSSWWFSRLRAFGYLLAAERIT